PPSDCSASSFFTSLLRSASRRLKVTGSAIPRLLRPPRLRNSFPSRHSLSLAVGRRRMGGGTGSLSKLQASIPHAHLPPAHSESPRACYTLAHSQGRKGEAQDGA